jgi:hypothetical protein
MANRNRVSERLGALAAWKWVDLLDELRKPRTMAKKTQAVDGALAAISVLVFESMHSLSGELGAMIDKKREKVEADRKRRISLAGHEGKRLLHERTRRKLVEYALSLRRTKPNRSDAVRTTLRRFGLEPYAPKPRTLHEWLKAEGWTRDTPSAD